MKFPIHPDETSVMGQHMYESGVYPYEITHNVSCSRKMDWCWHATKHEKITNTLKDLYQKSVKERFTFFVRKISEDINLGTLYSSV